MHIDYEGLCGQSLDDRNDVKHHIEELVKSAGFPYHEATLADIFIPQEEEEETLLEPHLRKLHVSRNKGEMISNELSERTKRLKELFNEVTSVTAKEDLLLHLFRNLVQRIAKDHRYDYVMLGDCGSNIAVRILADVAQGRGSQLPYSVSFKDGRSEVPVLRPMREFTKKEIQFYNCFSQVTSFAIPSFSTKASTHASIHRLTEELIVGLQAGFPSTVNTVLKTGDKISSNFDSKDLQHCALCLAPLGVRSGFLEVFSESKTCGSDRCGSGGDCQKTDGDGGTCYQSKDDGDGNGIGWQKSDTKRGGICTGNNEIDGSRQFCQKSDGSGIYGIDDGDDTLRDTGSHSDVPKITSAGDSDMTGAVVSDGTSGHVSTFGDSLDGKLTGSSESDGTLMDSGGYSGTPGAHGWCDQSTDDHNFLVNSLCYGCKLTYHDINNGEMLLPTFVTENSRKQFERKAMKEQIQDFLIHD